MKYLIFLITVFLSKIIIASTVYDIRFETDTIPPPVSPNLIFGEDTICIGETTIYTTDIPVGCNANWYINNELQTSTTGILEVVWSESGSFLINLDFECNANITQADSLLITVTDVPNTPMPIVGDTEICSPSTAIYTTQVAEGELCEWVVDGVTQASETNTMEYYWDELGLHNIEVRAINNCGISDSEYLDVEAIGLPVVDLGNDTTIIQGQILILDAGNPGSTYLWSTDETTQQISVTQSGEYYVDVTNECGSTSDTILVDVAVGVDELSKSNGITVSISGHNISIKIQDALIDKVQIWDMTGRLILNSSNKRQYHLPEKGIFYITAVADNGNVYSCKILK